MCDRPGSKAQISFCLATASRKEEQIHDFAIGMKRVLQTGQVQQDEGKLKRSPARGALRDRVCVLASLALTCGPGNRLVHGPECKPGLAIPTQEGDASGDALPRLTCGIDKALSCGL